jgi:hypothetical protein
MKLYDQKATINSLVMMVLFTVSIMLLSQMDMLTLVNPFQSLNRLLFVLWNMCRRILLHNGRKLKYFIGDGFYDDDK